MVIEAIFIGILAGAAGVAAYGYRLHTKEVQQQAEQERELQKSFRKALVDELNSSKGEMRLSDFADRCGVGPELASEIARSLYRDVARRFYADGVLSEEERNRLERIAISLELGSEAAALSNSVKRDLYQSTVEKVLSDGIVEPGEAEGLDGSGSRWGSAGEEPSTSRPALSGKRTSPCSGVSRGMECSTRSRSRSWRDSEPRSVSRRPRPSGWSVTNRSSSSARV